MNGEITFGQAMTFALGLASRMGSELSDPIFFCL